MVQSKTKTVKEYLDDLPADRRKEIAKVRSVVRKNLPQGYRERIIASTPPERMIAQYEAARPKRR
jgi:hypothetical protein